MHASEVRHINFLFVYINAVELILYRSLFPRSSGVPII